MKMPDIGFLKTEQNRPQNSVSEVWFKKTTLAVS